ncbi:hypothetical protein PJK45_21365 [Mycobacterium kansasii]
MGQPLVAAGIIPGVVCVIASVIFSGSFVDWSLRSHYGGQRISSDDGNSTCPMMRHGDDMMGPQDRAQENRWGAQ